IDAFSRAGLKDAFDDGFDLESVEADDALRALLAARGSDGQAELMLNGLKTRGVRSALVRWVSDLPARPNADAVLAAICATLAWGPLRSKRISRLTAVNLPWFIRLFGAAIGASVEAPRHRGDRFFCELTLEEIVGQRSLAEVPCRALLGRRAEANEVSAFRLLVGLLLTGNGPGAITLQGAKGAVSADGPENPERVQLNKAMVGFLTHAGYAHGGNGYEGIAFLIEQFKDTGLADPGNPKHGPGLPA